VLKNTQQQAKLLTPLHYACAKEHTATSKASYTASFCIYQKTKLLYEEKIFLLFIQETRRRVQRTLFNNGNVLVCKDLRQQR